VKTLAASKNGMKNQMSIVNVPTFSHSEVATQIPYTVAAPIMPMKCSLEMFEPMNDPPTTYHGRRLPARKYCSVLVRSRRPAHQPTRDRSRKYMPKEK